MTVRTLRILNALAIGVLIGWLCTVMVRAEDDPCAGDEACLIVYVPGICAFLEPYSPAYYFWNCHVTTNDTIETVDAMEFSDGTRVTFIKRQHPDGSVTRFVREQRMRKGQR